MAGAQSPARQCDVCSEPAKYLDYTAEGAVHIEEVRSCKEHHDLAYDYKPLGGAVDQDKKREWVSRVDPRKDNDRAQSVADKLMRPDRDGHYHSRKLTYKEKFGQERDGIERTGPSYGL